MLHVSNCILVDNLSMVYNVLISKLFDNFIRDSFAIWAWIVGDIAGIVVKGLLPLN